MNFSANRHVGLDLARTFAILGVVLVHTRLFDDGRFGVQLFFMLSGYLLVKVDMNQNAKEFITRRALRLFPLFWFFCGGYYIFSEKISLQFFLLQFFLIQNLVWSAPAISGAWSISNEWLYSLMVIPIQKMGKSGLYFLILLTWCLQVVTTLYDFPARSPKEVSWLTTLNPFINLTFFLIGVGMKRGLIPIFKNIYAAAGLLITLCGFGLLTGRSYIFLWTFGVYLILSACLKSQITLKPLVWIIRYIGERTYSIFFIHFIVLDLVYQMPLFSTTYDEGSFIMKFFAFGVILTISALTAEITWRFIERPSIQLAKKFKRAPSGI